LNYFFKHSFSRFFKKLDRPKQIQALAAIEALKTVLESDIKMGGLGFKQLRKNLWEIRISLKDRILFEFEKETIVFIMIGNHDEVKRFLKNL
jgi:mRNA-degrading endonuclease RelE of RelBE toxin-antitoxin system